MKITIGNQLNKTFSKSVDFISQQVKLKNDKVVTLFFIDNMIDKEVVNKNVVDKLLNVEYKQSYSFNDINNTISVAGLEQKEGGNQAEESVLGGFIVVWADWFGEKFLSVPCQGYKMRTVAEPPTAAVQKGPREGFTEDLNTNLSLIRRRVKNKDMKTEELRIGRYTNTKIVLTYIDSIADPKVLGQIKKKIKEIDIDGIIDSFYIETLIAPRQSTLFKQIGNTEKPDVAVARMLEGRVLIVVDGSPIVLTVPYVFLEDLQSGDDYYGQVAHATFIRILRVLGIIISITLPGIYVALQSFHYGILPIDFLISIQASIEGLSFPPLIEILVVLFLFEILNEASVRMPKQLGMAMSIIGALVLGDTAVQAGIITPPSIVVVAISGITLYIIPNQASEASVLRTLFTVIGGIAGFYGLFLGVMFLVLIL